MLLSAFFSSLARLFDRADVGCLGAGDCTADERGAEDSGGGGFGGREEGGGVGVGGREDGRGGGAGGREDGAWERGAWERGAWGREDWE